MKTNRSTYYKNLGLWITIVLILVGFTLGQVRDKILKQGNGAEPGTLDPHFAAVDTESNVIGDMLLGLMTETADGKVIPGLAEKYSVSADGMTYTFTLREARWSDNKPITADDFVFSLQRILDPKNAANYAYILYPIKNAKAINEGKAKLATLGVRAVKNNVLEIKLENPTPYFIEILTHYAAWAAPKHVVTKYGNDWTKAKNIVVSGPFILQEWSVQNVIRLKKNPMFFDAKNVKLDGIEYYPIEDGNTELNLYRTGALHITKNLPGGQVDAFKEEFGNQLKIHPFIGLYYYTFNTRNPKLKDVRVRQALSMAVQRDVITDKILKGGQQPAYAVVSPGMNNYVPLSEQPKLDFSTWSVSKKTEEAKKLMSAAGFSKANPLKVEIKYNTSEGHKSIAVAIAAMWKEIYVETELLNQETKVHYENLQNNNFEIGRAGWIADYNDPTTFTDLFLDNPNNYSGYVDQEVSKLNDQAAKTTDLKKRALLLKELETKILASHTIIPLYFYVEMSTVSPKVVGWEPNIKKITAVAGWIYVSSI